MLTIEMEGVRSLLGLLQAVRSGKPVRDADTQKVLAENAFFVDFYSQWEGMNRQTVADLLGCFDHPDQVPPGMVASRLAEGFRQALDESELVQDRLAWASQIDVAEIARRILAYLPAYTPLDSTIHLTVDLANNAFVHQGEMGVSLLSGVDDRKTFEEAVSHELHHVCVRYWSAQDAIRQSLLQEHSGRSIAVMHVENLLMEGLANYYLTPGYVFRANPSEPPADPHQGRLARLQGEEASYFALADKVLDMALEPGATYEDCWEPLTQVVFDMEKMILPAGHYLGARMVQTIQQVNQHQQLIRCIQHLDEFLPLYNEAASKMGNFFFNPHRVSQFSGLWNMKEKPAP